jgi:sec-independent protein translocase protein TatA
MFNLGLPEMLVIGVAALLLFGPKRLPELAKSLGKGIRDFKKAVAGEDEKGESPDQISKPGENLHAENKEKTEHKVD